MKRIIVLLVITSLTAGCKCINRSLTTVKIRKNQTVFFTNLKSPSKVSGVQLKSPQRATILEDGDVTTISFNTTIAKSSNSFFVTKLKSGYAISSNRSSSDSLTNFYFARKEANASIVKCLRYRRIQPIIQAIALPVKFRHPTSGLLSQVEAGPSFAFAPGLKQSWSWYKGQKGALGLSTNTISVAGGILMGIGTVSLSSKNTNGLITDATGSTNPIFPVGLHITVGVNNINLGFAIGQDLIGGPHRSAWVYDKQWWTGVIVGLDILK